MTGSPTNYRVRRRELILLLGSTAAAWPLVGHAQQPAPNIPRIGILAVPGSRGVEGAEAVRQGLRELGYIEGETIAFDIVPTAGRLDRLRELSAELVRRKVAVIVTFGPQLTQAAREATDTIPIVMARMATPTLTASSPTILIPKGTSPDYRSRPAN